MFIHNNTTKQINDVTYSVLGGGTNKITVDTKSANACSIIPAGGVCRVGITTPKGTTQGSNLIQAQYQNPTNKNKEAYNQLFQYQEVKNLNIGLPFTTSTNLVAKDGKGKGSKALYYYVPGKDVYKVNATTSSPALEIRDRTIANGQEVVGDVTVFAYDIDVPLNINDSQVSSASFRLEVSASSTTSAIKTNDVQLGAQATNSLPLLSLGLAPVINSSIESTIVIPVLNSGSALAQQIQPSLLSSNTGATITGNTCGSELNSGSSCLITVTVPKNSVNTDNLAIGYAAAGTENLNSSSTSLAWYKSAAEPIISYSYSLPTFYTTQGNNLIVTLSNSIANSSSVTVQSLQFSSAASSATSSATIDLSAGIKPCASNQLSAGNSCTLSIALNDSQIQPNGNAVFLLTGIKSDGKPYTRYVSINYVASSYDSQLAISSSNTPFSLTGDNVSISDKLFTVINTGAAPATLESFIVAESVTNVDKSWFNVVESGGAVLCTKGLVLSQGDSCNFKVSMGPVSYGNIITPLTESGLVPIKVSYYQAATPDIKSVVNLYNYAILPNNQDVAINNVTIAGKSSGDGSQANPVVFNGSDTSTKTISVEYTNTGTNPISILSLNNHANPFMWTLGGTCTIGSTLQAGQKCTITYTSAIATYASTGYQGYSDNTNVNITTPEIGIKDSVTGDIFVSSTDNFPAPINSNTLYANAQLAKVTNVVSQNGGSTMLFQTITNAVGYTPFQITFDVENYFNNPTPAAGCAFTTNDTVLTQSCTVNGNGVFSPMLTNASWAVSVGATLNVNFGVSGTNNQTVLNTPTFVQSTLQQSANAE